MQTKDVSEELTLVLTELHQQGKTPSVALVKSRLTSNVPMPAIVAAIRGWKGNQTIPKIEVAAADNQEDDQKINQLTQQVDALTVRICELESKVEDLLENQTKSEGGVS